jgi:hypothetical protein
LYRTLSSYERGNYTEVWEKVGSRERLPENARNGASLSQRRSLKRDAFIAWFIAHIP